MRTETGDSAVSGRELRATVPRSSHSDWSATPDRAPLLILEEQSAGRIPALLPIRYGRMAASPFSFFRGAAAVMAADLASTPTTGIRVQACGDAHISNFGGFASPDRGPVFGLTDFDETLPGPWEWDVKRMAAGAAITARQLGAGDKSCRRIVGAGVGQYRRSIRDFAARSFLDVWYDRIDADPLPAGLTEKKGERRKAEAAPAGAAEKLDRKTDLRALGRLIREVNGELRFINSPPLITPVEQLLDRDEAQRTEQSVLAMLDDYAESLTDDRRHLFRHYRYVHLARKVVGVGSVGIRDWVVLLRSRHRGDPLILQVKEAGQSVLAPFAGPGAHDNQGRRVVEGQRLTQSVTDLFLGWLRTRGTDGIARDFYLRRLWDCKYSPDIAGMDESRLKNYCRACGAALALAHARSGDRHAIASYLGKGDVFDRALARFAATYADRNQSDYERFRRQIAAGRVIAQTGI